MNVQTQPKTQYITQLQNLAQDLNIKHRQIVKQLTEIIKKLNEVIPPIKYSHEKEVVTSCWQEGSTRRCHYCSWAVSVDDGKPYITLLCNVSYSGESYWEEDPIKDLEKYKEKRNYRAIHALARAFIRFLRDYLNYLEQKQKQLEGVLADLNVIMRVIEK